MKKWYDEDTLDNFIIISSRIRLARNIRKYPFSLMLNNELAEKMIKETSQSLQNSSIYSQMSLINLNEVKDFDKIAMVNKHIISPAFLKADKTKALLLKNDETISIMLNEEDHIRMQAVYPGNNLLMAYDTIDKIDNIIEETIEYAFDKDMGYLTSCPTNTGTGLRASYMVHLPMLETTGHFKNIVEAINKFGMTVRGIYGEGTEAMGSIYQISNQVTMGKNEHEIMESLRNVTNQIIEKENMLREVFLENNRNEMEDRVYRSYGILSNARKISSKEAIKLLSDLRVGYMMGILKEPKPSQSIYNIMINIQTGAMQSNYGREISEEERDTTRANYIRTILKD